MSCSLDNKLKEAQEGAIQAFIGNGTGFKVEGNTISRRVGSDYSKQTVYNIFQSNLNRVKKWAAKKYGDKFSEGWGFVNTFMSNEVSIKLTVPEILKNAFKVQADEVTVEQVNNTTVAQPQEETEEVVTTPESEAYKQVANIPGIKQETALKVFTTLFTPTFKRQFGQWEDGNVNQNFLNPQGEPKLFFRTKDNQIFDNYAEALRNANGSTIEAGYISNDDILEATSQDMFDLSLSEFTKFGDKYKLLNKESFIGMLEIPITTDPRTVNGFTNLAILEGILKDSQTIAGETVDQKTVNMHFLKTLSQQYMKVVNDKDFNFKIIKKNGVIVIDGKEHNISDLVEDYLKGKNVQKLLGVTDINLLLIEYVRQRNTETQTPITPVTEEEELNLMANLMSFLKQLGFSVTTITNYTQNYKVRNGVDLSVEAITDVANNVVAFAEGKLNSQNLAEETAHIIIEAHNNKDEINAILPEVVNTREYAEYNEIYREKYSEIYSEEELENAVRKEILGKILAKNILEQYNQIPTQTPQNIFETLRGVFQNFIKTLREYYVPTQKLQLKQYIKKATDIAQRKDSANELNLEGMGQNTILYSVGKPSKEERDLTQKNRRKKITLEKLKRTLEARLATLKNLKDPETSRIQTAIVELSKIIEDNDILLGANTALRTHSNQISALQRRLLDYKKQLGSGKNLFTQEDASAYNYLVNTAEPILLEFSALIQAEDAVLSRKLLDLAKSITQLKETAIAQQATDPLNLVDQIVELKGRENMTDKEVEFLERQVTQDQQDISSWTATFSGLQQAGNLFLGWLGQQISSLKTRATWETNRIISPILTTAKKQGWDMKKFKQIIKYNDKGENTGYLKAKIRYEDFYKAKEEYYKQIYVDLIGQEAVDKFEKEGKRLTPDIIPQERFEEYSDRVMQWKLDNEEMPFTPEYYRSRNQDYTDARIGKDNRLFLEEISRRRNNITSKYRKDGRVDYSKLSEVETDTLAQIRQELKARKSLYDAQTGEKKIGLELEYAEELIRLDEIRAAKARTDNNISADFLSELQSIETSQGREAALKFLMANAGIALSEEYWNSATKANSNEENQGSLMSPLQEGLLKTANEIENLAERSRVIDIINNYVELLNKRKAILKQHTNDLNPSEVDAATMTETAMKNFLQIEEEIELTLRSINSIFAEYRKTLVPTTSTEVTTNEAYERLLKDSGLGEVEFIKNNTTDSSREKIKRFDNGLKSFGATNLYLEKFIVKFMVTKYSLGVYNANGKLNEIDTLKNIENFLKKEGKEKVLTEYAKTKVAGYFKRFAPQGYMEFMDNLKTGTESVYDIAERINNKQEPNLKLNVRYDWLEAKEDELNKNDNYSKDDESGYSKPKIAKWRDNEYYSFFGIDMNGNATRNVELFEMQKSFKEMYKKGLEGYNEKGLNLNKLPQMSKTTSERTIGSSFSQVGTNVKEWFNDAVKNRVDDLQYGEKIDGEDLDEAERIIPKYYLRDLETKADISEDLINTYTSFLYSANLYKEKVNTINDVLATEQMIRQKPFQNGKSPDKSNVAKTFKNFKDGYFYGVKATKKVTTSILGKEIDLSKTITMLDAFKRKHNNAFSIPIAVASATLSNINLRIDGYIAEHMPTTSIRYADKMFRQQMTSYASNYGNIDRKDDMYLKGEFFGLHDTGSRTQDRSYGKMWKAVTDLPFSFMTILSTPHANKVMYAVLDDYRFVDGEYFINFDTFKRRFIKDGVLDKNAAETAWEKQREKSANNLLELEAGTNNYKFKDDVISSMGKERADKTLEMLRNRIESINGNIDGVISETDRSAATRHWLMNLLTSHKGWLSLAIDRRFKRRHFNYKTMQEEEGHYRSFKALVQDIGGKGLNPMNIANTIKSMQENYNKLSPLEQKNIRRAMTELAVFGIMSILSILVAGAADDEDNKEDWAVQFFSYMYLRATAEMGNSQLPFGAIEFTEVAERPFMIFSAISDFKEDLSFERVQTGRYEGYPKILRGILKQTYLKQLYQIPDIKATADQYRQFNKGTLFLAQKRKKSEEQEESQERQTLLDLERD